METIDIKFQAKIKCIHCGNIDVVGDDAAGIIVRDKWHFKVTKCSLCGEFTNANESLYFERINDDKQKTG